MQPNAAAATDSIVIYRSVNREGQTFALEPESRQKLRDAFGRDVRVHPRLFIAHETSAAYEQLGADLAGQVIVLLTGMSEQRLAERGFEVSFVEPVSETIIPRVSDESSLSA